MKLYSRFQLVRSIIISVLSCFAIGAILFIFVSSSKGNEKPSLVAQNIESDKNVNTFEQLSVPDNSDSFLLQTSVVADPVYTSDMIASYTQDELQNISVYEKCNEAVVNINTQIMAVNWFLEPVPQEGGSGSGSIIDKRGYVVTNVHVISDAYKIYISLSDGTQYEGRVVGTDSASDIAVLKFDPPKDVELKTISFGDSDNLKVGQKLIAIGNPFGFERTMTTGIVSGLGRPIQSSTGTIIRNMIQTDTAINPGNSGGPLLDTKGRMVGINTMIYSTSGSSAGIGFAVPVNTARRVVSDLIQYGKVRRGVIDAEYVQLTSSISNYARLPISSGLLVSQVEKKSNAEKGGLKGGTEAVRYGSSRNSRIIYLGGDVITAIDGIKVSSLADYYSILESKRPGDIIEVTVYRDGKYQNLSITLSEDF
ncbi:MAG: trypsin-like peptidase domain-containing protein [Spirochaetaceae bacterium]|nr:trypsin-like serine protease [Spirochaetaceae bacterium]MBO5236796.1 trypsin-like peptidase domain-containing protein [Spirochaetaceae bacterium]